MLGFEFRPPEINSGLMYAGPGAGPMTAASLAWDALADDLYLSAAAYGSAITDLISTWLGPSSISMSGAAATYVSWIGAIATQAAQTGAQAKAAVAAYEAAFAMTVPPAVIAANRALLMALVATNFFGQNTPAIMATEADYVEMWAQDAAAMYGYAGASSAASTIAPFTAPLETTNSSGVAGLAAAATQAAGTTAGTSAQTVSSLSSVAMPGAMQALSAAATSSTSTTSPLTSLVVSTSTSSSSTALTAGTSLASGTTSSASMLTSAVSMLGSSGSTANSLSASSALGGGFPMVKSSLTIGSGPGAVSWNSPELSVSAASGRAASLGALSVPEGWTSAAPAFSQVPSAVPGGGAVPRPLAPLASAGQTGPLGLPKASSTSRSGGSSPVTANHYFRPAVVQRPVYTG